MHVREPPQPPFPEAKPSNIPLKQRQLRTVKVLELSAVCRFQAVGSCESAAPRPLRHTCSLAVQRYSRTGFLVGVPSLGYCTRLPVANRCEVFRFKAVSPSARLFPPGPPGSSHPAASGSHSHSRAEGCSQVQSVLTLTSSCRSVESALRGVHLENENCNACSSEGWRGTNCQQTNVGLLHPACLQILYPTSVTCNSWTCMTCDCADCLGLFGS